MKYSVIIPIYNAASTIERCLDSLLNQPHENVEILLINDGSTDASGEICRQYARQHDGVHYFEKENGGVSSARNLGLENAVGEFILFVDSDDYVTPDYFAVIDEAMARWNPDMLMFGLQYFGAKNDKRNVGAFVSENVLEISKYVRHATYAYLYSNLMTRTFRGEIIRTEHLRFDEVLCVGEDHAFIFAYTMYVKRMAAIDRVLYKYSWENCYSLTRRKRVYLTEQLLRVSSLSQESLRRSGCPERVRRVYRETAAWSHYRSAYSACKELRKFDLSDAERRKQIRGICKRFSGAGIAPIGLQSRLIALPVIGKMSWVIDGLSRYRESSRK